jgi:CheY-like chemotaxis protein/HPt (histidine-containing phosphotransfer) domain-containing protein
MPASYSSRPSVLKRGVDFFQNDYERNKLTIDYIRYIGLWGHPLYYLLCAFIFPQPYESFELRFASAISFIPILFHQRYPEKFRSLLMLYWYLWLTFTFPVVFTYLMLMNDFSGLWLVAETVMLFVFIIFITNYFLLFVLFISGILIAYAGFVLDTGAHLLITTEIIEYFVSIPIAILLGLLVNSTNKKGELAQERNSVLQSLAGSIAHEMRNPLGQIRHCLYSIQNLLPQVNPEECDKPLGKEKLETLYERVSRGQLAVKRGAQVIDMVLSEVRERPIGPESFTYLSATRVTRNALDEFGYESEQDRRRVHLETKDSFIFHINETLFVLVLFNLLKNALFYFKTHPHSEISVRLERGERFNYLYFRDTGPGISSETLPFIFDSFYTTGKASGTGLGLSYCKRIMTAFGGSITCKSVEGEYSEFILSFPVISEQDMNLYTERVIAVGQADFQGKRLLIVDDSALYRSILKKYFAPLQVEIDEAAGGREALDLLSVRRYDLVIMDLNMPSMSGYETVERLRRGEAGPQSCSVPVVAHSSESVMTARSKSENAGMQAFIAKPCSQAELISSLRSVLDTIPERNYPGSPFSGRKVLLVDDSALNRDLLAMYLRDSGIEVTVSDSGAEALNILRNQDFELLITDIHMPGMDGLELTRTIRSSRSEQLCRLPIIGLSGAVEEEVVARKAGMNDFRIKTDSPNLLLASIGRQLSVSGAEPIREKAVKVYPQAVKVTSPYGFSASESEELRQIFLEEFRDTPVNLRRALKENDMRSLKEESHKLKGSAAILGAMALSKAAEELELHCRFERSDDPEPKIERIIEALEELSARND